MQVDLTAARIAAEAAARSANFSLIGAVFAALVSATVTLFSLRANRRLQTHIKNVEGQTAERIAKMSSELAEQKAEHDAARDYEYEARKRLYREAEPLLFRLGEAAENALYRVISLARTARDGDLGSTKRSWLAEPGYYMASTIYNLLIPAAVYRLLQERLTLVDLGVDSRIQMQYLLAKVNYLSFTEDFALAKHEPRLKYNPFIDNWKARRTENPAEHWRQGTTLGWLDIAVDSLIATDASGKRRVASFGEFGPQFAESAASDHSTFSPFIDLFLHFDPVTRPVLWRILVLQAMTCRYLLVVLRNKSSHDLLFSQVKSADDLQVELDWHHDGSAPTEVSGAFLAADAYYRQRYPALIERISQGLGTGTIDARK